MIILDGSFWHPKISFSSSKDDCINDISPKNENRIKRRALQKEKAIQASRSSKATRGRDDELDSCTTRFHTPIYKMWEK